ncbi:hypothetical protein [Clostridium sp. HBUAS56010]|uniref:hypothetical protein n=1 Tax=Clostridium sp. HBUAS56010 TaxID=2571127 RepID=UPI001177F68B|nr:hypothetical protein [Clostridium sp. HBUAS56010]
MGRPGYMSIYAEEKTQKIFDEFLVTKGIKKTDALTDMLEIYMISQDENLYLNLKKKAMNIDIAKEMILQSADKTEINDYIFMKLSFSSDIYGNELDGEGTMEAYLNNSQENGLGYTWFSTQSLHFGMNKDKVAYYNKMIKNGDTVRILFAVVGLNDVKYSAVVEEIVSSREKIACPGDTSAIPEEFGPEETAKIWIKISNIQEEKEISADMLSFRSNGNSVKAAISKGQFHFGYVYLNNI